MKLSGRVAFASISLLSSVLARAADAGAPIDYTRRNADLAPAATVVPEKKSPAVDHAVQDQRMEKTTVTKPVAPLATQRAPIDVVEAREKNVRPTEVRSPDAVTPPRSALDHRVAAISPTQNLRQPTLVAKYQDEMKAASAYTLASFPALDRATTAKLNRFVFRKNPDPSPAAEGAPVIPAAGGSALRK
jgi:hypothetical protein